MFVSADDDSKFTRYDTEQHSNKVANFALSQKWAAHTTIGLFMPNRIDYLPTWLGLAKVGIRTALINCNLKSTSLVHSIKAGECKAIIYDAELTDALKDIMEEIKGIPCFAVN